MYKISSLLFFIFFSYHNAWAQQGITPEANLTEKQKLTEKYYDNGNIVDALIISREFVVLAEQSEQPDYKIKAYILSARINRIAINYETSEQYLQKAEMLCLQNNNHLGLIQIKFIRAATQAQIGYYHKAILIFKDIYPKSKKIGNNKLTIDIASQLGSCYMNLSDFDSALYYTNQIIQLINFEQESNHYIALSNALQNKAYLLMETNELGSVLEIINTSIKMAQKETNLELESEGLYLLAYFHYLKEDFDKSLVYIEMSNGLVEGKGLIETEHYIADLYYKLYLKKGVKF